MISLQLSSPEIWSKCLCACLHLSYNTNSKIDRHLHTCVLGLCVIFSLWLIYGIYCHTLTYTVKKGCRSLLASFTCNFSSPVLVWELLTLQSAARAQWDMEVGTANWQRHQLLKNYRKEVNISHENFWKKGCVLKLFHFAFLQWKIETST